MSNNVVLLFIAKKKCITYFNFKYLFLFIIVSGKWWMRHWKDDFSIKKRSSVDGDTTTSHNNIVRSDIQSDMNEF